jgi:hypothetical protein
VIAGSLPSPQILPAFDGGDYLHLSDVGQRATDEAVPLRLFDDDDDR